MAGAGVNMAASSVKIAASGVNAVGNLAKQQLGMVIRVTVCCSALQCVAVCCSVLQCECCRQLG